MLKKSNHKYKPVQTEDGSFTLFSEQFSEHFHSLNGASTEAMHIYINAGLKSVEKLHEKSKVIRLLEVGFGTGLNAFLTLLFAKNPIQYYGIDAYPFLNDQLFNQLSENICSSLSSENQDKIELYKSIYQAPWDKPVSITKDFHLKKINEKIENRKHETFYDLIYYDAFSPKTQPEMWDKRIFKSLFDRMNPKSFLTTYCAKGEVRRNLEKIGFDVKRLPGPPGKREIILAYKA